MDRELEEYLMEIANGGRFANYSDSEEMVEDLAEGSFYQAYIGGWDDGYIDLATDLLSKFKTK